MLGPVRVVLGGLDPTGRLVEYLIVSQLSAVARQRRFGTYFSGNGVASQTLTVPS